MQEWPCKIRSLTDKRQEDLFWPLFNSAANLTSETTGGLMNYLHLASCVEQWSNDCSRFVVENGYQAAEHITDQFFGATNPSTDSKEEIFSG